MLLKIQIENGISIITKGNHKLFFYLRELDRAEVDIIYAEMIDEQGLGFAVMNRMKKAAGGKILS